MVKEEKREVGYENVVRSEELNKLLIEREEEYKILSIEYKKEIYRQEKIIKMLKMKLKKLLNEIDKLKIKLNFI